MYKWVGRFRSTSSTIPLLGSWMIYGTLETELPDLSKLQIGDEVHSTMKMKYSGWYRGNESETFDYTLRYTGTSYEIVRAVTYHNITYIKATINLGRQNNNVNDLYGTYVMTNPRDSGIITISRVSNS